MWLSGAVAHCRWAAPRSRATAALASIRARPTPRPRASAVDEEVVHQHRLGRQRRGEVPVEAGVAEQAPVRRGRRAASRPRWGRGSGGRRRGCAPRRCPRPRRSAGRRRSAAAARSNSAAATGAISSSAGIAHHRIASAQGPDHEQGQSSRRSKRPHVTGALAPSKLVGAAGGPDRPVRRGFRWHVPLTRTSSFSAASAASRSARSRS